MIGLQGPTAQRKPIDRGGDRRVAMTAIGIAVVFLCLALLSALLPATTRAGSWLPLHLALAGAASTAIAGVLPFFTAAFAAAAPIDAKWRWTSIATVALGALAVTSGYVADADGMAIAGGTAFVVGIALVAASALHPLRRGLGPRGGMVAQGYLAALGMVMIGALLAILFIAGWPPVLDLWGYLKPAHAWLNLVGFVSLVIATTLLHFFPTVVGARIQHTPAARLTIVGLALGTALVALGFATQNDLLTRAGAVLVLMGAWSLAAYALTVWRTRAQWTTDARWHRFAMGGLISAIAWFEVGVLVAAGRLLAAGAEPTSATTSLLLGPLVAGWMGLAVLASATHLVPAVGPGDPAAHAQQRRLLGRAATARLLVANLGIAVITVATALDFEGLAAFGWLAVAVSLAGTAALILASVIVGLRHSGHPATNGSGSG